jgi:hypothetical protein
MAALIYIPTNNVYLSSFSPHPLNVCCLFFWWLPFWLGWDGISVLFWFAFNLWRRMWNIFSCIYKSSCIYGSSLSNCLLNSFVHLLIGFLVLLEINLFKPFMYATLEPFNWWITGKYFVPLCWFSFYSNNCYIYYTEAFKLMQFHLSIFSLISWSIN